MKKGTRGWIAWEAAKCIREYLEETPYDPECYFIPKREPLQWPVPVSERSIREAWLNAKPYYAGKISPYWEGVITALAVSVLFRLMVWLFM